MEELVGECVACGKEVFCRNGFLDGVVSEDKKLYCHDCALSLDGEDSSK